MTDPQPPPSPKSKESPETPNNNTPSSNDKKPFSMPINKKGIRCTSSTRLSAEALAALAASAAAASSLTSKSSGSSSSSSSQRSSIKPLLDRLPEFEPIDITIKIDNLNNYFFYKVVLWMKSAHKYVRLNLDTIATVPDWPPLTIHGFFPVDVSPGTNNKIVPGDHRRRKEGPDDKISVVKPELDGQIKLHWPSLHKTHTDTYAFLRSQARKHNMNRGMFPDNKDFIEKGLRIGVHFIDKICEWTDAEYRYGDGNEHDWKEYTKKLHEHLNFATDCRFHKLEYQPTLGKTLYGLEKIGLMGILEKKKAKQWKWNPVHIEVNEDFVLENEMPEDTDQFILEYLQASIVARSTLGTSIVARSTWGTLKRKRH